MKEMYQSMKDEYTEINELSDKITEAMNMSLKKLELIESKKEELYNEVRPMAVEEGKEKLAEMEEEKTEFDEMTKRAIDNNKEQIAKWLEEEYPNILLEIAKRKQDIQQKLEAINERYSDNPEVLEKAKIASGEALTKVNMAEVDLRQKRDELANMENKLKSFEQAIEQGEIDDLKRVLGIEEEKTDKDDENKPPREDDETPSREDDEETPSREDDDGTPGREDDEEGSPRKDDDEGEPQRDDNGGGSPRRDKGDPQPRRDDGDPQPRRDEGDPQPRRDDGNPQPRRETGDPQPRRDDGNPQPRRRTNIPPKPENSKPKVIINAHDGKVYLEKNGEIVRGVSANLEEILTRKARRKIFNETLETSGIEDKDAIKYIKRSGVWGYNPVILEILKKSGEKELLANYLKTGMENDEELKFDIDVNLEEYVISDKKLRFLNRALLRDDDILGTENGIKHLWFKQFRYKFLGTNPKGLPEPANGKLTEKEQAEEAEIESEKQELSAEVKERKIAALQLEIQNLFAKVKELESNPSAETDAKKQSIYAKIKVLQARIGVLNAVGKEELEEAKEELRYVRSIDLEYERYNLPKDNSEESEKKRENFQFKDSIGRMNSIKEYMSTEMFAKLSIEEQEQIREEYESLKEDVTDKNKSARENFIDSLRVDIGPTDKIKKQARNIRNRITKHRAAMKYHNRYGLGKLVAKIRSKREEKKGQER